MNNKNKSHNTVFLKGRVLSKNERNGIAGVLVKAAGCDSKHELDQAISNEDGGFHFSFKLAGPAASHEVSLQLFDVNQKQLSLDKDVIRLNPEREQTPVELIVDDTEIQNHRAQIHSLKPSQGRVFAAEKLNEIYNAINSFGNTQKKYFINSASRPGLTCPFPEIDDYGEILFDAWETIMGDLGALVRFKASLDSIAFKMSKRPGVKTTFDFQSDQWKEFVHGKPNSGNLLQRVWQWLTGAKPETPNHSRPANNPMMSLESAALLMRAADYIAKNDAKLSNHYRNIVFSQLIEYARVAPVYKTAHNALLGDTRAQSDLRSMITIWGEDCGGGRPPLGNPNGGDWGYEPSRFLEPDVEEFLGCLNEMMWPDPQLYFEYRIESMSPNNGCAGQTAILRGSGFQNGAEVIFVGATIDSAVAATPTRMSDTEIEFVIPANATYGAVTLRYPYRNAAAICGTVTGEVYRDVSESPTLFIGGRPRIDRVSFFKDDVLFDPALETVWPGQRVTMTYENTLNAPDHWVEVQLAQLQTTNGRLSPAVRIDRYDYQGPEDPGRTTLELPATDFFLTSKITYEIRLTNGCGTTTATPFFIIHRPAVVELLDMEVTQGIQFLNATEHMRNDDEAENDNSVPLISHKRTLVRVYYRTSQLEEFNLGMSFGLQVTLRGFIDGKLLDESPLTPINSNNLFAVNTDNPWTQRARLTRSANFLLPDDWTVPTRRVEETADALSPILDTPLTLVAELSMRESEEWVRDTVAQNSDELRLSGVRFNSAADMECVVVRVNFTGPGGVGAPSFNLCARTLSRIALSYPTGDLQLFRPPNQDDWVITHADDLTADPGNQLGCGDAWNSLMFKLDQMAFFSTNDDQAVWTGCLDPNIPFTRVLGCGGPTLGAAGVIAMPVNADRSSLAFQAVLHELGHSYGISGHSDDEGSGFPDYMDNGLTSIGEWGVDVGAINAADPSNLDLLVFEPEVLDIMTHFVEARDPRWFSPYTYRQLMDLFFSNAESSETQSSTSVVVPRTPGEQLFISGFVDEFHKQMMFDPIFHLPAKFAQKKGNPSGYEIVLLDANQRVVHRVPIRRTTHGNTRLNIFERVPLVQATKHVEIRDDKDATILKIERAAEPPTLQDLHLEKKDGQYTLTWRSSSHSGKFWCGVQLTCDDGRQWTTLNKPAPLQTYSFDPAKLGGGNQCRLRVFVTDGFNTIRKETEPFSLPIEPPEIHPLNFDSETVFRAGLDYELRVQPVYILGVPHQTELTWFLDKKPVGKGLRANINFKPGEHLLEIVPKDFEQAALSFSLAIA